MTLNKYALDSKMKYYDEFRTKFRKAFGWAILNNNQDIGWDIMQGDPNLLEDLSYQRSLGMTLDFIDEESDEDDTEEIQITWDDIRTKIGEPPECDLGDNPIKAKLDTIGERCTSDWEATLKIQTWRKSIIYDIRYRFTRNLVENFTNDLVDMS